MRVMMKAEWSVGAGNALMKAGKMKETLESILDALKPEAAYFIASNGKRSAVLFLDLADPSQLPIAAEPWFLAMGADIEITPAMVLDDLLKAAPAIDEAVKAYG